MPKCSADTLPSQVSMLKRSKHRNKSPCIAQCRENMEEVLSDNAAALKEIREEQATARRKAKEAQQEERNRQIAKLIAG